MLRRDVSKKLETEDDEQVDHRLELQTVKAPLKSGDIKVGEDELDDLKTVINDHANLRPISKKENGRTGREIKKGKPGIRAIKKQLKGIELTRDEWDLSHKTDKILTACEKDLKKQLKDRDRKSYDADSVKIGGAAGSSNRDYDNSKSSTLAHASSSNGGYDNYKSSTLAGASSSNGGGSSNGGYNNSDDAILAAAAAIPRGRFAGMGGIGLVRSYGGSSYGGSSYGGGSSYSVCDSDASILAGAAAIPSGRFAGGFYY